MSTGAGRAMEPPREIELKLELDPRAAPGLGQASLIRGVQGRAEALSTVYFDTDRLDLRAAGLSLRVRQADGRRIQTIKAQRSATAGLFDRAEWEREIGGDGPDLAAAGAALERVLSEDGVRAGLHPVFTIRVDRMTYPLKGPAWAVELTVDQGVVEAGERASALCELELELKQGRPADLFAIARTLCAEVPARLGVRTKADRGYALVENKPLEAAKAKDSGVAPGMTAAAAFQAIGRACLNQLLSNERPLREARDPEAVHQMRVAMRRLRAAMSLFKAMLADERRDTIRNELRWIANVLGAARDLDVFMADVLAPVRKKHPGEPGLEELAASFQARREQSYERALAAVDSPRFRTLTLDAVEWVEAGPWLTMDGDLARAEPIETFAAAELASRRKKIRKRGADLADLDPHARHRVRIAVKKLRYTTEFFSPLYEGRKTGKHKEAFLSALEDLQERLGELNDFAVSREAHPDWFRIGVGAKDNRSPQQQAARLIVKRQAKRADAALKPALKAYRAFAEAKRFWH